MKKVSIDDNKNHSLTRVYLNGKLVKNCIQAFNLWNGGPGFVEYYQVDPIFRNILVDVVLGPYVILKFGKVIIEEYK